MKRKVGLIFGGSSVESEVSVITAVQAFRHIDDKKYVVEPIYVYDGDFYVGDIKSVKDFAPFVPSKHKKVLLYKGGFYTFEKNKMKLFFKPDVILNCCHGGEGENGILQGMFEFCDLPHTSPSVLYSAVCMDKAVSKVLFENDLLNVTKHIVFSQEEYSHDKDEFLSNAESLGYPLIIKPARLGSSIGITPAHNRDDLETGIDVAFSFDNKVVVEVMLTDFVEVNCAAFRGVDGVTVSQTEQPLSLTGFLSFEDKYSSGKMSGGGHVIPADIGALNEKIKCLTKRIYENFDLQGVVRIDYLVDKTKEKIYVNEINTVPGSLAYYLFERNGITYSELIDKIIEYAITKKQEQRARQRKYTTGILDSFAGGCKVKGKY
jgi:D-alanine-D-alanine ligase